MADYINDAWRPALVARGIIDFETAWRLEAEWFEEPNRRRNGWSGVARVALSMPPAPPSVIFLKRQENHNTFSWRHPLRGEPTFAREFRHIMHYRACGIPTLDPVYFAMRVIAGKSQAILATAELTDFMPLDLWIAKFAHLRRMRLDCIIVVATLLRNMHQHGIQHNCFFPKHIFVRTDDEGKMAARVIDLEKSRWRPFSILCALRDLDTLNRYAIGWTCADRMRFIKAYLQITHMTCYAKWLWQRLATYAKKKNKNRLSR